MEQLATSNRRWPILLGGVLLAAYVALLISLVWFGQGRLRQSIEQQAHLVLEKQAAAVGYFLNEQRDAMQELSRNPALRNFFANRALGMSMEYGLRASLMAVGDELERIRDRKRLQGRPVYSTLAVVGDDGAVIIAAAERDGDLPEAAMRLQADDGIRVRMLSADGGHIARLSAPIEHRGRQLGWIIAETDLVEVLRPLLQQSDRAGVTRVLRLSGPDETLILASAAGQGDSASGHGGRVIEVAVPESALTLSGVVRVGPGQMLLTSRWFLVAVALLTVPVLVGVIYSLRLNNRHLVLRASYDGYRRQQQALERANQRFAAVLDGLDSAVCVVDIASDKVLYENPKVAELSAGAIGEACWRSLQPCAEKPCSLSAKDPLLAADGEPAGTLAWECQNPQDRRWLHCTARAIPWDDGRYVRLEVATDITSRVEHEKALKTAHQQLQTLAYHDPLTGLANRRLFIDRLQKAIQRVDRSGANLAVCYMDIDGFKAINERFGHRQGDQLLVEVAQRLRQTLRGDDTVARWGGDEFALLITGQADEKACAEALDRLLESLSGGYDLPDCNCRLTSSIGVTVYPLDKGDADTLLRHADQALYIAKQDGRSNYRFFDPVKNRLALARRERIGRIAQAIEQQELRLRFQPMVDIRQGRVCGVEALVRWQHPHKGLLAPGAFLPAIDGHELQYELDWWVLEHALAEAAGWREQGLDLVVSINLHPQTILRAGFSDRLVQLLARVGVPGGLIELEILESAAIEDLDAIAQLIRDCATRGVFFALDDYGTGYSSLNHIRRLPVKTLKIDQTFVRNMLKDHDDFNIVEGVIGLAHAFERQVIAEGVESAEIAKRLAALGCHLAQGYGIARPMPGEDLTEWVRAYVPEAEWRSRFVAQAAGGAEG